MNEFFISVSMEIGVIFEVDTSTIRNRFYIPVGAIAQRNTASVFA
jgi:hypothetical protein